MTFNLYGPANATCFGAPVFTASASPTPSPADPSAPPSFTPTATGTYRWSASYSGDPNNAPVTGACNAANETAVVNRAAPGLTTTASPDVALGGTLSDTATVSGRVNPQPGATVDLRASTAPGDADCTGTPVFTRTVPYPVAGGPVSSGVLHPDLAGIHRWIATYSGDDNNDPVTGACNDPDESTTVAKATTGIATTASADITLGSGTLSDTATVSGRT